MKVVLATDGSEPALAAAREALSLLRPGAEVVVVAVVPDREDPMEGAGEIEGPVLTEEQAEADARQAYRAGQDAVERTADEVAVPTRTEVVPSTPAPMRPWPRSSSGRGPIC